MKMKSTKLCKILSFVVATVLIAAMAFSFTACDNEKESPKSSSMSVSSVAVQSAASTSETAVTEIGEGAKSFSFICYDSDGKQIRYIVKTDAVTVGEALLENGLIAGEDGDYGLYVKTVCGITADYDVDKTYWAFYINGEYAMSGVDRTDIAYGAVYEFKIEK